MKRFVALFRLASGEIDAWAMATTTTRSSLPAAKASGNNNGMHKGLNGVWYVVLSPLESKGSGVASLILKFLLAHPPILHSTPPNGNVCARPLLCWDGWMMTHAFSVARRQSKLGVCEKTTCHILHINA